METRRFGRTELEVSLVGFGAWAIGGPATAGGLPIGWGPSDDDTSMAAIARALEVGITCFDTADFYGLGHSEELVGRVLGNRPDVVVATKVGQRLTPDGLAAQDYSKTHIVAACEASLRRLRRETIDLYQLHTARLPELERGECLDAMEQLRAQGKIRYWGLSLATFAPGPEAEFLLAHGLGHGVQLALNIINQRAVPLLARLHAAGYGVIARMPYQFGLLTGAVTKDTRFDPRDHRSFRLAPALLDVALPVLDARGVARRRGRRAIERGARPRVLREPARGVHRHPGRPHARSGGRDGRCVPAPAGRRARPPAASVRRRAAGGRDGGRSAAGVIDPNGTSSR